MDYTARCAADVRGASFAGRFAFRKYRLAIRLLEMGILAAVLPFCRSAFAQARATPSIQYFNDFGTFYDGDYYDALKGFQSEARGSIKSGTFRWVDSICYETMMGECYYQMGSLDKALDAYSDALRIYVTYADWMVRMNFTPNLRAAGVNARKQVPWGISKRPSQIAHYPTSVLISQGNTPAENANIVNKTGGIVQQAILYPINPQEIVRCTALAMRRRAELLGPMSKNDALTADVASKTTGAIGPPNHWSEAWTDLERGLANVAAGREGQGIPYLQRSILAAGEFEHPLTCVALLELGRLKLQQSD